MSMWDDRRPLKKHPGWCDYIKNKLHQTAVLVSIIFQISAALRQTSHAGIYDQICGNLGKNDTTIENPEPVSYFGFVSTNLATHKLFCSVIQKKLKMNEVRQLPLKVQVLKLPARLSSKYIRSSVERIIIKEGTSR